MNEFGVVNKGCISCNFKNTVKNEKFYKINYIWKNGFVFLKYLQFNIYRLFKVWWLVVCVLLVLWGEGEMRGLLGWGVGFFLVCFLGQFWFKGCGYENDFY